MSRYATTGLLLFLPIVLLAPSVRAEERGWSLRELPLLDPVPEQPLTEKETQEIRNLIKSLAQVDAPDIGYCSTMAGDNFLPVPAREYWSGWTSAPHEFKQSIALKKLVAFGPRAIPLLLDSLADKTATKLTLRRPYQQEGGIDPGREVPCNPMNLEEARVLKRLLKISPRAEYSIGSGIQDLKGIPSDHLKDDCYRVTVGDLCFVALGQITNRRYQAARYQATGCVVVTSPANDARMAEAVRALWSGKPCHQQLFASLLTDFHTRGGDERGFSQRFQIGAGVRLLYYFPTESGPVLARRLRELVTLAEENRDSTDVHAVTTLRLAEELFQAVNFSQQKEIRKGLLEVFRRTTHPALALATLPAVPPERDPEVLAKLKLFLRALPATEESWADDGFELLKAIGARFPNESAEILREYVKNGSAQRRVTLCRALREKCGRRLVLDLLVPLLSDKTTAGDERYSVKPDSFEPRLPLRICDEVAVTIAQHRKELSFKLEGTHKDLDQQLEQLRKKLAAKAVP